MVVARLRFTSDDRADTTTALGARFLFEGVSFGLSSNDTGDGATFRQIIGIRQGGGAGVVDNPGDGLYVAIANDFFTAGGTNPNANSFLFSEVGGVRTQLADFDFDTLDFVDDPASVVGGPLDFEFTVTGTSYALEITGDTVDGGAAASFSGVLANTGLTTGGAFFGNQTESPNVLTTIDRVEIEQIEAVAPAIPEPSSIALLGFGALGLVARRRRNS